MSVESLQLAIQEDRVLRGAWIERDADGRERACLLATIAPECGIKKRWSACPSTVMPPWLAALTPWMDDRGSFEAWPAMIRRYAAVAARWHVLTSEDWRQCLYAVCIVTVREAMTHTSDAKTLEVCHRSIDAIEMCATAQPGAAAEAAAAAAEAAAAAAAEAAAAAAAWRAAAWRAAAAAEAAAAAAAWRAAAWRAAAWRAAAADRITSEILRILEEACTRREAA